MTASRHANNQGDSMQLVLDRTTILCGVDEAGRGPLAGPVCAAAVILDPARPIVGLNDSKKLTEKARERLAFIIKAEALAWHIAFATVEEIDRLNILQATMLAMTRAVEGLRIQPEEVLVDGNRCPQWRYVSRAIVEGDAKVAEISAASILAKTARDAVMIDLHEAYPQYNFAGHKGYGTAAHLRAIKAHGPCPEHRRSFAPVREMLAQGVLF
jgi:ribonuclease HII